MYTANQSTFDAIISTLEHFVRDTNDYSTARLALSVIDRTCHVWGGPDVSSSYSKANITAPKPTAPNPSLPGFDSFMLNRFSPLSWALLSSPAFNAKDPQARQVLGEIASLQQDILAKTGDQYLTWLKDVELKNMGAGPEVAEEYLRALAGMDMKAFRGFLTAFVGRAGGGN